jgi:hypothetical protein
MRIEGEIAQGVCTCFGTGFACYYCPLPTSKHVPLLTAWCLQSVVVEAVPRILLQNALLLSCLALSYTQS